MITANQLCKEFLNKLKEQNTLGVEFRLFIDTGEFAESYVKNNELRTVINGIYSTVTSDIMTTASELRIATINNRVELLIPCKDDEETVYDEYIEPNGDIVRGEAFIGNETYLNNVRNLLNNVCSTTDFFSLTDSDGKVYDISVAYTLAVGGERAQLPEVGDCFSFEIELYYNFVENGENSRQWQIYLDNERVPYTSFTLRQVPTQEGNIYNGDLRTTNITIATTFGLTIEMPMTATLFSKAIKEYIVNGSPNTVHLLTMVLSNDSTSGLTVSRAVVFGEADGTASGVANVGLTINIIDAPPIYNISNFPNDYKIYRVNISSGDKESIRLVGILNAQSCLRIDNFNSVTEIEQWSVKTKDPKGVALLMEGKQDTLIIFKGELINGQGVLTPIRA